MFKSYMPATPAAGVGWVFQFCVAAVKMNIRKFLKFVVVKVFIKVSIKL